MLHRREVTIGDDAELLSGHRWDDRWIGNDCSRQRVSAAAVALTKIGFRKLAGLLVWCVLGLLWQSLAIWFLVAGPLDLPRAKWWVVAGAYALAWCAGFLAVWAPGGIGVRELVFMAAMQVALPPAVRQRFQTDPAALTGFLAFLSVLLRLWTIAGELMLTAVAYLADFRRAPGAAPPSLSKTTREPAAVPVMQATVQELD